jgi:DNA-binding SARP family transcriptional activator/tetratricopeptide (TPR) repeat protein
MSGMTRFLSLLGPVHVTQIEEGADKKDSMDPALRFRSKRTMALLGYLATERRPHAREQLAILLWPDISPAKGRSNLRRELYNLSRVLPDCWQTDKQAVSFTPSAETTIDIDELERLESEKRWQGAADLLAGEFLEGLYLENNLEYETWLIIERERWRERSQVILREVIEELTRFGRYADALPHARRLLQITPWDEENHRTIMRLLAWSGQREAALRQFSYCKQALADELELEPSEGTILLYRQILDRDLKHPPPLPAFLAAGAKNFHDSGSLFVLREQEMTWLHGQLDKALLGQGRVAFVTGSPGRGKTALMQAFADEASVKHADLLIAKGNCVSYSGMGDPYSPFRDIITMLGGDVEGRWAAGSISIEHAQRLWSATPLVAHTLLEHGPDLLFTLVEGAALLKRAMAVEPSDASWVEQLAAQKFSRPGETAAVEQNALFEQFSNVLRIMALERPLLLLLDDIQWMDAASIGLLFHLVRRITEHRSKILILCAYRPQGIIRGQSGPRSQLAQVLSEFRRIFGDVWLGLGWASEDEGQHFVNRVLDGQPNDLGATFRKALYQRTAGHPLFTIELLRAMRERGYLILDTNGCWREGPELDWQLMPARVEAVIEARIQQLEPKDQELLSVASVEGEQFTAQVLAQVQNLEEGPLLRLLAQELGTHHRLVQEQETYQRDNRAIIRFGFRHTLFREYLYKRLSSGERNFLHGAVAAAIETIYAPDLETMSMQLAQHYDKAGDDGRALHYYTLAADHAASIFAFDEAIANYTRALVLSKRQRCKVSKVRRQRGTGQSGDSGTESAELYYGRGLAYRSTGKFDLARVDLNLTLDLSQVAKKPQLEWQALIELGKLWTSRDYNQARSYWEQALSLAQRLDDPALIGRTLNRMGNWHANDENPATAIFLHQESLRIFEEQNDRPNLANTLDLLGIGHLLSSDFSKGLVYYNHAIELFRELNNYPRLISGLVGRAILNIAPILLTIVRPPAPRNPSKDIDEAVEIARRIGSSPDEAWSSWALSLLHTIQGDFGRALEAGCRGLQLASEIRHREWQVGNRYALGVVYNELFQPKMALRELEPALALAEVLQSRYWVNHVTGALTQSYILLDDLQEALRCLDGVITEWTPMDTAGKRYCWARRAELALAMNEASLALNITERLINTAAGLTPGVTISFLWLVKGEALASLGRLEEARAMLVDGRDHAKEAHEQFLLWRFHAALADLNRAMGEDIAAAEELAAGRTLIEKIAAGVVDEGLGDNLIARPFH